MNMGSYTCCQPDKKEFKKIVSLSSLLKVIGEESRLKLLCILKRDEHCVCEILEHLDMSQSLISHHLTDLKKAGLVVDRKSGLRVYYRLTKFGGKVMSLLGEI
jgi:ArsR family transcriptional regulator